jgi:hypothetical protein
MAAVSPAQPVPMITTFSIKETQRKANQRTWQGGDEQALTRGLRRLNAEDAHAFRRDFFCAGTGL